MFSCFINIHHLFIIKKIIKKYNLNTTLLHTSAQYVNNLITVTNIQNENITMRNADYLAAIIYFKNLIKHLNVEKTISMTETVLLDNCFKK